MSGALRWSYRLLIAVALALILCEIGLRLFIAALPKIPEDRTLINRRLDPRVPQYANSPYWSVDFVMAMSKVFDYRYMNEDMQFATADLTLPGYTVRSDERSTSDQPSTPQRDVWLFGSSTVWSAYTDDAHTIASYLQREFNRYGVRWRVRNMGQIAADTTLQYYWLRRITLKQGDVVIFIDGGLDLEEGITDAFRLWQADTFSCQIEKRISLLLLRLWCETNTYGRIPSRYLTPALEGARLKLWRNVNAASAYAKTHDAVLVHVWQPTPAPFAYANLYGVLTGHDPVLLVRDEDRWDDLHYDDDGNAAVARQIYAALFGVF